MSATKPKLDGSLHHGQKNISYCLQMCRYTNSIPDDIVDMQRLGITAVKELQH